MVFCAGQQKKQSNHELLGGSGQWLNQKETEWTVAAVGKIDVI